jgi:hypothetical protein
VPAVRPPQCEDYRALGILSGSIFAVRGLPAHVGRARVTTLGETVGR